MNQYSSFGQRLISNLIDSLILLAAGKLIDLFFDFESQISYILYFIITPIYTLSYFVILNWKYGQTIGKMAMKIIIVDITETKGISLKQSILRDSVWILFELIGSTVVIYMIIKEGYYSDKAYDFQTNIISRITIFWALAELITVLFNKKRRAIHDFIGNTVVIKSLPNIAYDAKA